MGIALHKFVDHKHSYCCISLTCFGQLGRLHREGNTQKKPNIKFFLFYQCVNVAGYIIRQHWGTRKKRTTQASFLGNFVFKMWLVWRCAEFLSPSLQITWQLGSILQIVTCSTTKEIWLSASTSLESSQFMHLTNRQWEHEVTNRLSSPFFLYFLQLFQYITLIMTAIIMLIWTGPCGSVPNIYHRQQLLAQQLTDTHERTNLLVPDTFSRSATFVYSNLVTR